MKLKDYKNKYGKKYIVNACKKQEEMNGIYVYGNCICPVCNHTAFEKKELFEWRTIGYCWSCGQKIKIK